MSAIVRTLSSLLRKHYSWPSWPRESLRGYVVHNVRALQKQGKLSQSFGYTWLYVNLSEKQSHRNTIRNHTFVEVWEKNARIATQLRPPCCVAQVKTTCLFTIFLLLSILHWDIKSDKERKINLRLRLHLVLRPHLSKEGMEGFSLQIVFSDFYSSPYLSWRYIKLFASRTRCKRYLARGLAWYNLPSHDISAYYIILIYVTEAVGNSLLKLFLSPTYLQFDTFAFLQCIWGNRVNGMGQIIPIRL